MKKGCLYIIFLLIWISGIFSESSSQELAEKVINSCGITKGVCVILGGNDIEFATELYKRGDFIIKVIDPNKDIVAQSRSRLASDGSYGSRLSIDHSNLDKLPYPDNFVNLIVINHVNSSEIKALELKRILRPLGVIWVEQGTNSPLKEQFLAFEDVDVIEEGSSFKVIKHRPSGMDNWSHRYHGPDNNQVSNDQYAIPPYRTQFVAEPPTSFQLHWKGWAIAGDGWVVYYTEVKNSQLMYAVDGHNGFKLWERTIPYRSGGRRDLIFTLAGTGNTLFNIGHGGGCEVIDVITGEVKDVYNLTKGSNNPWSYVAFYDGTLYGIENGMFFAMDPLTGNVIWKIRPPGALLCIGEGKVFFHNYRTPCLVAIDAKTRVEKWRNSNPEDVSTGYYRHLSGVVHSGKLLLVKNKTRVFSVLDGSKLWEVDWEIDERHPGGIIIGDKICGDWERMILVQDLNTKEVVEKISMSMGRCAQITGIQNWFFSSGGTYAMNIETKESWLSNSFRSACGTGTIFGNGLCYSLPNDCYCGHSVLGIKGLAPTGGWKPGEEIDDISQRFKKGEAFDAPKDNFNVNGADWPRFRYDNKNSGATRERVALPLIYRWTTEKLNGNLTPPAVADEMVFVGTDNHFVYGIDAKTGKIMWRYIAEGAITVTPTIYEDLVLFGDMAGFVTCLKAKTGKLVYSFRAAPEERYMLYYNNLISTWPVTSGILIDDDIAYFFAGRCSQDGAYVYAMDPRSGSILWQNPQLGNRPFYRKGPAGSNREWPEPIKRAKLTRPRLYYAHGTSPEGVMVAGFPNELIIPSGGFGAPVWVSRSDGRVLKKGPGNICGKRLMIFGDFLLLTPGRFEKYPDDNMYRKGNTGGHYYHCGAKTQNSRGFRLFKVRGVKVDPIGGSHIMEQHKRYRPFVYSGPAVTIDDEIYGVIWRPPVSEITGSTFAPPYPVTITVNWLLKLPIKAKAAIVAGENLFVAGRKIKDREDWMNPKDDDKKSLLFMINRERGEKLFDEIEFPGEPVYDGMAAANGHLYISTSDGHIICYGGRNSIDSLEDGEEINTHPTNPNKMDTAWVGYSDKDKREAGIDSKDHDYFRSNRWPIFAFKDSSSSDPTGDSLTSSGQFRDGGTGERIAESTVTLAAVSDGEQDIATNAITATGVSEASDNDELINVQKKQYNAVSENPDSKRGYDQKQGNSHLLYVIFFMTSIVLLFYKYKFSSKFSRGKTKGKSQ